jgi:hypothetical protein
MVHGNSVPSAYPEPREERRRRQIDHAGGTELALHRLDPGNPQACGFVVLRLLALVAGYFFFLSA